MNEEKKLTDEEIVKSLECCTQEPVCNNCPIKGKDYCSKPTKLFLEIVKLIKSQKAEIERLTELQSRGSYRVAELGIENAELQKQVDELKAENTELYKEHTTLIAGAILEKQELVKDTAKEILQDLFYFIDGNNFWLEETGSQVHLIKEETALNFMRHKASKYKVEVDE